MKDNDPDPVEPACNRHWMYYVLVKLYVQTDGRSCYYCYRVWSATMKHAYKTITAYKDALRNDGTGELIDKHNKYMHWMIARLAEEFERIGSRQNLYLDIRLTWPKPWILSRMEITQLIWDMPEDVFRDDK